MPHFDKICVLSCFFDSVNRVFCKNIQNYAEASKNYPYNVRIKYIIIPGVNDNVDEIDKFFDLLKKLNIKDIALDIEVQYARKYNNKDVSEHIFLLSDYFLAQAKKFNITCTIYSFISYVLKNRTVKESKLMNFKPLFKLQLKKLENKNKNIKYER